MANQSTIQRAFDQGKGILRLAPNWVPRSFCIPGMRIKLHPDDYYALGGEYESWPMYSKFFDNMDALSHNDYHFFIQASYAYL
jgi:hypothetical protein